MNETAHKTNELPTRVMLSGGSAVSLRDGTSRCDGGGLFSLIAPQSQISVCSIDVQELHSEEISVAGGKLQLYIGGYVRIGSYQVHYV